MIRRVLIRSAGVLAVTLAFLAVSEVALRLYGFHAQLSEASEAFPGPLPMFRPTTGPDGVAMLKREDAPVAFRRDKPPNGFRVFVIGESSAYGFPFGPEYAFSRFLQERMTAAWPDRAVEVVNAAMPGIGSWQARQVMDEIAAYQPDVVVVYLGHNELSRTGPAHRSPIARLLSSLRFYQLAVVASDAARGFRSQAPTVDRMRRDTDPFGAIRDRARGVKTQSAGEREAALSRYRDNLQAIVATAQGAGAKVVLAGLAQNIADHPPGASRHRPGLSDDERARWRTAMQAADRHLKAKEYEAALEQLRVARDIDARPALLHYMRGQCLEALERFDEAAAAFREANERDEVPLGATDVVNRVIGEVASATGSVFVDVLPALARSSPHGLVGRAFFCDSIHPSVAGHAAIAVILAEGLGVPASAVPPADVAGLLAAHPEIQDKIYRTNTVFYLILGWHEMALAEVDEAAQHYPDMQKVRKDVLEFQAKDPVRSWDDLPPAVD
jgi:tetratricopeptide (TPR) repeat protein